MTGRPCSCDDGWIPVHNAVQPCPRHRPTQFAAWERGEYAPTPRPAPATTADRGTRGVEAARTALADARRHLGQTPRRTP